VRTRMRENDHLHDYSEVTFDGTFSDDSSQAIFVEPEVGLRLSACIWRIEAWQVFAQFATIVVDTSGVLSANGKLGPRAVLLDER
jgi:hypothetical protein